MIRIKRGFVAQKRRKKILKINKSSKGAPRKVFRVANQKYIKSKTLSYKNRKKRKTFFRGLWINRINSATRLYGVSFSQFIAFCQKEKIQLNRKIIAQLVIYDFDSLIHELKASLI